MRLAILASHPIQYQAPLFRELSRRLDLTVFFAHRASATDQARGGFGVSFDWDVDLLDGYDHVFLENVSRTPGLDHFGGCDTPGIAETLRRGRFNALFVMGWHLKTFWQGIRASKFSRTPVLVRGDSHLSTPRSVLKSAGKRIVYPRFLRMFDVALYPGERSRAYWKHYSYPDERLVFSPHCVDNAWFSSRATEEAGRKVRDAAGIPRDATVVLFAGKLMPGKRPLDLIAAARALNESVPGLVLLIAGAGELEERLTSEASKSNVRLIHLGFCNQTMMPSVYAASDILVLPSESETWGLVANEALACGRPIIVSDACGCAPDLAGDSAAGRVFRVGNPASLAEAIAEIAAAPPAREAIARKADAYSVGAAADGVCRALTLATGAVST